MCSAAEASASAVVRTISGAPGWNELVERALGPALFFILLSFGEGGPSLLKYCAERSGRIERRYDGIRLDRFPAIRLAIHLSAM